MSRSEHVSPRPNICIYYIKGKYKLDEKMENIPADNLYISEVTLAEHKYDVQKSEHPVKNAAALANFLTGVQILPIVQAIDVFAKEKARLRKAGTLIDDFDLLIGSTAIAYGLIMVTANTSHLGRIKGIRIENWAALGNI